MKEKNIWLAQAIKVMEELWGKSRSPSMRGMMAKVYRISDMERAQRKKYMGVCRLCSLQMVAMMSRFPSRVNRYISRNSMKKMS